MVISQPRKGKMTKEPIPADISRRYPTMSLDTKHKIIKYFPIQGKSGIRLSTSSRHKKNLVGTRNPPKPTLPCF